MWKRLADAAWHPHCTERDPRISESGDMDSNYVFLCGVIRFGYGQQEAGKELLRATRSVDPDIRALA